MCPERYNSLRGTLQLRLLHYMKCPERYNSLRGTLQLRLLHYMKCDIATHRVLVVTCIVGTLSIV
jgi:hypothetical protein